ncbi:PREDICTED: RRP12-like protein [Wasmannia auropunctata]|uniref:RRP12-like protein n=1 Tax=Wasmannia auropunctata TaxID=64793 RepID=UPI0005EF0288|nr:PREDICTED: RRP12-like protein [Wasmannia auropunctata]
MGKLAPRLASRKKAKRWAKGQSSSSNPATTKHREQATGMFFKDLPGGTPGITSEDLRKHDAIQGIEPHFTKLDIDGEEEEEASSTVDGGTTVNTCDTFATDYSNCSNLSFGRFLSHFQSSSIVHKEMLAVLAAVTEVIKQNGGNESSTEYFAALMSTLEAVEDDTAVAATLSLLGMCLRTVPRNVLNLQFGPTTQALLRVLSQYVSVSDKCENYLILRHCIGCLSVLLRAQEAAIWTNSSTMQVLDAILSFVTHAKPKVRKSAQHGICAILKDSDVMKSDKSPTHHPAAGQVATHCIAQLNAACEPGSSLGVTTILHILTLLKDITHQLPKSHVRTICERLLSIMTLNNVLITSCCLQTLHGLFVTRPSEATLPFARNANIIKALYDYQPSVNDTQPTLAWLAVMREAHCNLAHQALPRLCSASDIFSTFDYVMPEMLNRCIGLLLSNKTEIVAGAAHTVKAILQECVAPLCENEERIGKFEPILRHIVEIMHKTLSYQYLGAWCHVLHLIAVLFQITGKLKQLQELANVVKTLGNLRDSHDFSYNRDAEYAIGAAIRAMGPRVVLNILPLGIDENTLNLRRSWMVPLLKDCITGGTIALFKDVLLPLALRCEEKAKGSSADVKTAYECLVTQIWSILPSICNDASDVKDNFKHIAKLLGIAISDRRDLRLPAMAALRKLVVKATQNITGISGHRDADDVDDDIAELARFAKNYLPILFNLYTTKPSGTDEEGARLAAYDTIKTYMTIASSDLANDLFDRALSKLEQSSNADDFFRESVYDLTRGLIGYIDIDRLSKHYEKACVPVLKDNTKQKEQKKAYRLLEEICGSEREVCKRFLHEHRRQIERTLISSATSVIKSSRGARLRCLAHLVRVHPQLEKTKFLEAIVPEAVLCVKDINERCREVAYQLLNTIAERFLDKHPEHLNDYVDMLLVGLGGEQGYVSASLLALASITYHYNNSLGTDTVNEIFGHTCTILTSPTREIVESALSYMKVYINVTPSTVMAPTLPRIVDALSRMSEDCKRHFRQKVRDIFTKLIRKYGIGSISSMVPASDVILHKRLKNINKIEDAKRKKREVERAKKLDSDEEFDARRRPKSKEEILADSDEEFQVTENDEAKKRNKKRRTLRGKDAWIQENENDIVDLADPAAAKNITTTQPGVLNPKIPVKKIKDRGFASAPDGRIIITDHDNERDSNAVEEKNKKRVTSFLQSDTEDDYEDEDNGSSIATTKTVSKKRKYSESTLDAMSLKSQSTSRYRAGGSGIHRSLKTRKVDCEAGSEYRAIKARGDVKRKGKPDPYAYVPLTRSILNKRKKKKNAGKFQSIVSGARKGARTGMRNKRRKR